MFYFLSVTEQYFCKCSKKESLKMRYKKTYKVKNDSFLLYSTDKNYSKQIAIKFYKCLLVFILLCTGNTLQTTVVPWTALSLVLHMVEFKSAILSVVSYLSRLVHFLFLFVSSFGLNIKKIVLFCFLYWHINCTSIFLVISVAFTLY